jgi:hypothetical protein
MKTTYPDPEDDDHSGAVERRHKPFVPDPNRIVYPVDHATSQQYTVAKFEAEMRIEVGGQLTRRMIRHAGELEDEIRERARDGVHYALMAQALVSYMGDAIEARHEYMNPNHDPRNWR